MTTSVFHVVAKVSVPTLALEVGEPVVVRFLTPFEQAPHRSGGNEGGEMMKPPMITRVEPFTIEGVSKGEHSMVGGTVLMSILDERYPNDDYVGRIFSITKHERSAKSKGLRAGKADYFGYLIDELAFSPESGLTPS